MLDDLLVYVAKDGRVCPMPMRWQEFYEMLPNRRRVGGGWEPELPLILAAWHDTPALSKILRLREHLEWAAANGVLAEADAFLRGLPESDWSHVGEA